MPVSLFQRSVRRIARTVGISPIIERCVRVLCSPQRVGSVDFEVENFGCKFFGSLDNYIEYRIFFYGGYDLDGLTLSKQVLRALEVKGVLDVGANVGNHALYYSKIVDNVICLEPNPDLVNRLKSNIARSRATNITVFDVGLSDKAAELPFYMGAFGNFGAGSFESGHSGTESLASKILRVVRGDEFLERFSAEISYVKMDIEGHEPTALIGMREWASRVRPVFDFEFTETFRRQIHDAKGLMKLFPPDYKCLGSRSRYPDLLHPFLPRSLVLEPMQVSRSYSHAFAVPAEKYDALQAHVG